MNISGSALEALQARVARLEDESAIKRLITSYGPGADSGLATFTGTLWVEDGVYDWDADGAPHQGSAGVEAMLQSPAHKGLIAEGVAHFGGPLLLDVKGDQATALNYSLIMRRERDRFYLWRVGAVRWDLVRTQSQWRVQRRTNRLLDDSGAGSGLFGAGVQELFGEAAL